MRANGHRAALGRVGFEHGKHVAPGAPLLLQRDGGRVPRPQGRSPLRFAPVQFLLKRLGSLPEDASRSCATASVTAITATLVPPSETSKVSGGSCSRAWDDRPADHDQALAPRSRVGRLEAQARELGEVLAALGRHVFRQKAEHDDPLVRHVRDTNESYSG